MAKDCGLTFYLLALLIVNSTALWAAEKPPTLLVDVDHRTTISLDGDWHAIVDPYDNGYYDFRMQPRKDGYFLNQKRGRGEKGLVEYDFDASPTLRVPGDWNSQRDSLFFYEGTIWYEKDFDYHRKPKTRTFLHVGAANYIAHVWINGEKVCDHEGGFTPFDCEITSVVQDGPNFAVIYVNNQRRRDAVPTLNTDWWNYGGITRDVSLVEAPSIFIDDYSLYLQRGGPATISGWVHVEGAIPGLAVSLSIPELNISQKATTDSSGAARFSLQAPSLAPWSPENPKLYDIELAAADDRLHDAVGFRTIEVRGTDVLLNGKPVFLRGVSLHAEAPYRSGRAWSEEDARTLFAWARDLDANFVRLAHYPHDERMTRLADRMGILVWSEIPVYWMIDWENPTTLANAKHQLEEMIRRDRNKASVVLWSVANETPNTPARLSFLQALIAIARQDDPTRLVTAALLVSHAPSGPNTRVLDDPLGADLDVLGCNEYIGWYEGTPELADITSWATPYNKPMIMSEFGAEAKAGLHGAVGERWTEEYQAEVYRHQIVMLKRINFLGGMSPWILMDFRSPRRELPGIQDFYNREGLVSHQGQKKMAFYLLEEYYKQIEEHHPKH
jgi:beta-glucuronidase